MVNKRGWLRILEAGISVLLIFGVILIISSQRGSPNNDPEFTDEANDILEELSKNNALRTAVLKYDLSKDETYLQNGMILEDIDLFIESRLKQSYLKYEIKICDPVVNCYLDEFPVDKEVYVADRLISTTPQETNFQPKRIKIFVWIE